MKARRIFLIIAFLIAISAIGYFLCRHYEYKPKDKLAVYLSMEDGNFSIEAVIQKQKGKGSHYSKHLECRYFGKVKKTPVLDTLYDDLWSSRVLELASVFFGIISKWNYYPKNDYGLQLPVELQGVYNSNRLGKPIQEGYIPEIQLRVTERLALWYVVHGQKLYLLKDNEIVDKMDVSTETEAILNAAWCEEAVAFLNKE